MIEIGVWKAASFSVAKTRRVSIALTLHFHATHVSCSLPVVPLTYRPHNNRRTSPSPSPPSEPAVMNRPGAPNKEAELCIKTPVLNIKQPRARTYEWLIHLTGSDY